MHFYLFQRGVPSAASLCVLLRLHSVLLSLHRQSTTSLCTPFTSQTVNGGGESETQCVVEGARTTMSCCKITPVTVCFVILSIFSTNHANAFPLIRRRPIIASGQRWRTSPSTVYLSGISDDANRANINSDIQSTRREALQRAIYSMGLVLAATSTNPSTGNAVGLGLPNLLLSADGDNRTTKGMPAPNKKSSGLGYKIRSVSKVMVS